MVTRKVDGTKSVTKMVQAYRCVFSYTVDSLIGEATFIYESPSKISRMQNDAYTKKNGLAYSGRIEALLE